MSYDFPLRVFRIHDDQSCISRCPWNETTRVDPLRYGMTASKNLQSHVMDRHHVWTILSNWSEEIRVVTEVRIRFLEDFRQQCMQVHGTHREKPRIGKLQISIRRTKLQIQTLMGKHEELIVMIAQRAFPFQLVA